MTEVLFTDGLKTVNVSRSFWVYDPFVEECKQFNVVSCCPTLCTGFRCILLVHLQIMTGWRGLMLTIKAWMRHCSHPAVDFKVNAHMIDILLIS